MLTIKEQMIRWKLREVMARYNITGVALAKELKVRTATITNLRKSDTMPTLNGKKIENLTKALSKLAGTQIVFEDLYENTQSIEKVNFNQPIAA